MSALKRFLVLTMLLLCPAAAHGFGFGWWNRSQSVSYYYPAPASWTPIAAPMICAPYPAAVVLPVQPAPRVTPIPRAVLDPQFATPTPAPPSAGPLAPPVPGNVPVPETPKSAPPPPDPAPLAPPPPGGAGVTESRSFYDSYAVATHSSKPPAADRCSVGFWNLTDRDLAVSIAGQSHTLARGKKLTLDLPRQFRWQIAERALLQEQVADGQTGMEIVIRR